VDACTAALPDKDEQTSLQASKSDRVINAVLASYSALWIKYAPDDDSIRSACCIGDKITLMRVEIKGMLELNERYSDVGF